MRVFTAILCALCLVAFASWGGVRAVDNIIFNREVGGYLKRAGDSNTVELAKGNLETALKYIKSKGMTEGYTSVLWNTPDEDVGFWYANLSSSLKELKDIRPDATPLEKSNMLIKLRETLLDQGNKGAELTVPMGISVYPHNTLFFLWGWLSIIFAALLGMITYLKED